METLVISFVPTIMKNDRIMVPYIFNSFTIFNL
mgnify:CR=1 FL=1